MPTATIRRGIYVLLQTALAIAVAVVPAWAASTAPDQGSVSSISSGDAQATSPAASAPPVSQSAEGLQEVLVTATRREEALQRVPISVQAITGVQLDAAGVRVMSDIERLTPSLQINQDYGGGNEVAIRGIASNAGASTTGIYLDDTPLQVINHYLANGELFATAFDLQRVEVLRGPQGTLFGAGSEGGTVRFIQEQPSLTQYSGHARAEGDSIDVATGHSPDYEVGLAYGGPIVDDVLGFRVSAYYRHDGGYINFGPWLSARVNNPDGTGIGAAATEVPNAAALNDNVNWTDTKAFRAALRWQPIENLSITPSIYYQRADQGFTDNSFDLAGSNPGAGFFYVPQYLPGPAGSTLNCSPQALAAAGATGCPVTGPLTRLHLPTALNGNNQLSVSALNVQWNISASTTFISTTSYVYTGLNNTSDTTSYYAVTSIDPGIQPFPLPGEYSPTFSQTYSKAVTQEFRLNGTTKYLNWTVGVFYSHDDDREFYYEENNDWSGSNYWYGYPVPADGPPFGPGYSSFQNTWGYPLMNDSGTYYGDARTADRQLAGYAQVDIKFTSILSLTAGIRYASDHLTFSLYSPGDENNENAPFGSPCPPGYDVPLGSGNCPYGSGYWAAHFPGGISTTTARPVTPKFALNAQLTDHNLVYASATKGFRIGGVELPLPADCAGDLATFGYIGPDGKPYTPSSYKPDFVWSYELGSKNRAFDNKLAADASVYYIKWTDIQTAILLPTCGYDLTTNSGSATIKGFDLDLQIAPIHGLQLRTDIGYVHTALGGLYQPNGSAVYTRGSAIPGSGAPWNIVVSGRYERPLTAQYSGYFYADDRWDSTWRRTGQTDPGVFNYLPLLPPYPSYNTTNLRFGVIRGGLDVSFFMNNVFNARPLFLNESSNLLWSWSATTIKPRSYGFTGEYRF
jgi:iron complex outermembrane recepter protein